MSSTPRAIRRCEEYYVLILVCLPAEEVSPQCNYIRGITEQDAQFPWSKTGSSPRWGDLRNCLTFTFLEFLPLQTALRSLRYFDIFVDWIPIGRELDAYFHARNLKISPTKSTASLYTTWSAVMRTQLNVWVEENCISITNYPNIPHEIPKFTFDSMFKSSKEIHICLR